MFLAQCDKLGRDALIWPSDLEGIVNTEQGMILRYRCVCGEKAEMLIAPTSKLRLSVHPAA